MKKNQVFFYVVPALFCLAGMLLLIFIWQNVCQRAAFTQMSAFCRTLLEENPEFKTEVLSALQHYEGSMTGDSFLARYGYGAAAFAPKMKEIRYPLLLSAGLTAAVSAAVFFLNRKEKQRIRRKISGVTGYLEQINMGARGINGSVSKGTGILLPEEEDEFSHLRDEIYKTVTHLYATRDDALRAKKEFAENLANIAHQLKTPLTAALLSLQLMEESFLPFLQQTMENYGISGKNLLIELTETHFDEMPDHLEKCIRQCEQKGIQFVLDDFGQAYSSLQLLLQYPAKLIKLDRNLTREITSSSKKLNFIISVICACHQLGKKVCIEGVETAEELEMVRQTTCDYIQGFYFYKPMELDDLFALLRSSPTSFQRHDL